MTNIETGLHRKSKRTKKRKKERKSKIPPFRKMVTSLEPTEKEKGTKQVSNS